MTDRTDTALAELRTLRTRETQMLGAGLSKRSWHETEAAYNQLRDRLDRILAALKPAGEADEDTGCPPHCCCCGPGEPCCDCGEIISPAPTSDAVRAMEHLNSIDDPVRQQDSRGNPFLLYTGQQITDAFKAGAALSADSTTIEAAALEQAATDFCNRDKWPRPNTSYIDGSQP